jgi:hypothetical protein
MNIRVQREDGKIETIELSHDAWQVLRLGDINSLGSGGVTHTFTAEGYYLNSQPTAAPLEEEGPPEGLEGLQPTFA